MISTARTHTGQLSHRQYAQGVHGVPRALITSVAPRLHSRNCRAKATAANIKMVNAEELEAAIAARDKPIVVDFFATWCGPCLLLAQELEKVAADLGEDKVDILKLDVDQNADLSTRLQIQGLPTMIFISMDNNKPALRTEGLLPAETIKNIIAKEL